MDILKPARYIGNEWNSVHKDWDEHALTVALCFPDIYEIGMSHLGMRIIYGLLNKEDGIICERAFAPWSDMERRMRTEGITLFSLENKKGLNEFDIVGFSLQYEMNFTDVLNMLDLGRVPILAGERGDKDPLVIAGGPCCFNPEPMADFIDAFVIGEAEEAILEMTRVVKGLKLEVKGRRDKILRELAKISGVYVPRATSNERRQGIKKRIIKDLDGSYFPRNPIVPYVQIVHDRISIEIMRGCPHRCRFCQACRIFHPLRLRSLKRIMEIAEESVKNTGYEEISLLSLSTGDYPQIEELARRMDERFKHLGIKISLPSLRVRDLSSSSMGGLLKKTGLTFAPETGSDRLRALIGKDLTNQEVIEKSNLALRSGWKKVKLYFMMGLPGERDEDIEAIIDLSSKIRNATLSISYFIPKPHSEFEGKKMEDLDVLREKKKYLYSILDARYLKKKIKIHFHSLEMSMIEAVLSRGDRKMGGVIYKVWESGARLQAWTEYFDYGLWQGCFEECGLAPDIYLSEKKTEGPLPWSFIEA